MKSLWLEAGNPLNTVNEDFQVYAFSRIGKELAISRRFILAFLVLLPLCITIKGIFMVYIFSRIFDERL